jgi:RHS repeat-associated protein
VGLLGAHRYRHLDFRGNVKLVSDAAGRIVSHVRYGPYGADRSDGAPDPEAGFAQGRAAGELLLLGARLYDPDAARFLAPDPVLQLVNQYAYADGNPVWYWDPDGRSPQAASAVALGVALGVSVVAAITGNVPLVVFAAGFVVGLLAPVSPTVNASVGAAGGAMRVASASRGPMAPFLGFLAGQALQTALQQDFDPGEAGGLVDRYGDRPRGLPPRKEIDLTVEARAPRGSAVGGSATTGCSPASLALPGAPAARDTVLGLVAVQVLLGAALAWQRRRTGRR